MDHSGKVYVVDTNNHRVQVFTGEGEFLRSWGNEGSGEGQFTFPQGIAVDTSGNVYVADTFNNSRVQKFTLDGDFLAKWGTLGSGNGQLSGPQGLAIDGLGNVYVADVDNNRVQVFSPDGTFLGKWGEYGRSEGQFVFPQDIAVDAMGNAYVLDTGNNRVQVFEVELPGPTAMATAAATPALFPRMAGPLDQSNEPAWQGGWTNINPDDQVGQTFVTQHPLIMVVEINIIMTANPGSGGDTITMKLINEDGQLIASSSVIVPEGYDGWLPFNLAREGIEVPAGDKLTLRMEDTGKTVFGWKYGGDDTYPQGSRLFFGSPMDGDFMFRTYRPYEGSP